MDMSLSVDIGGTHTRLALFAMSGEFTPSFLTIYSSHEFGTFEDLLTRAFEEHQELGGATISHVTIGVAGTVVDNCCQVTNLPWFLDGQKLAKHLDVERVTLLNDLQAAAYGVLALPKEDFATLQEGQEAKGPIGIIGAGTGLGEAFLVETQTGYLACPTEGGHADFAPVDEEQCALLTFLKEKLGRVSVENVLSGPGLWNIYSFFDGPKLKNSGEAVTEAALEKKEPKALEALELFLKIYAQEAGNLSLRLLARGGIYFSGGIAPKLLSLMQRPSFVQTLSQKGVKSDFVRQVPFKVILNDHVPLYGAAYYSRNV